MSPGASSGSPLRTAGAAAAGRAASRWTPATRHRRSRAGSACRGARRRPTDGAGRGCEVDERRGHVLLRRRRGVQQVAGLPGQCRHRRGASEQARAASPACCSSRAPPAGPCPTRRRRTAAGARPRRADGIDRIVVVAAALPGRAIAGGEIVAGRSRQRRREQVGLDAWRPASSSLSSLARATSASLLSASSRSRSCAGLDRPLEQPRVLDRGRGLQRQRVQQLELGGRVGHRQRAAERHHANHTLADLQRRGNQRARRRSVRVMRRGSPVDVVDDLGDAGLRRPCR